MRQRTPIVFAAALVACGPSATHDGGGVDQGGADASAEERADARPAGDFPDAAPAESCDKMDILFVIDDSGSMADEQGNLAANFPGFISVLDSLTTTAGTPIDYRVGVTTTGVTKSWSITIPGFPPIPGGQDGADGRLLTSGCAMPADRPWLERSDPDVAGAFSCVALVGDTGPAEEMPLEAARLALGDRIADGSNAGFVRDDALLALVVLTDENDCSRTDDDIDLGIGGSICDDLEPVPTYLGAFDAVKEERGRWAAAIIAGVGPGPCQSDLGNAEEATRLLDFAGQVGDNAVTSSICEGDLSVALADALATFEAACQSFPDVD